MVRLTNHLEFLLAEHDCVVIPGIGGFVMRTLPSVYNREEHTFSPMSKEIVFNRELTHTDGLLVSSYARVYGKVFEEAQAMVEEDVAELEVALNQHGTVSLGSIGTLIRGEEGQLIFTAGNTEPLGSDAYGLPPFSVPALPKKDPVRAGRNRWLVSIIVVVAVMVAGAVWYITLPEKQQEVADVPIPVDIPVPVEIQTVEVEEKTVEEKTVEEEIVEVEKKEVIREAKKEAISAVKKAELETKESSVVKQGRYYVVIGSFPGEKKALSVLKAYKKSGRKTDSAGILHRDGRYRIYSGNYLTRADAHAALARIRRDERHKDAWLFIDKQ
jgi:hypothetical protein